MYLNISEFYKLDEIPDYYNFNKPYIIRGGCKNMKIFNKENLLDYIYNLFKNKLVDVEIYNSKDDMKLTNFIEMKKLEFNFAFDNIVNNNHPYGYIADQNINRLDVYEENEVNEENEILSIEEIDQIYKELFEIEFDKNRQLDEQLMFFGNNSYSGCHIHGHNDYVLNQIYGKKTVYLFDYYDNYDLLKDVSILMKNLILLMKIYLIWILIK